MACLKKLSVSGIRSFDPESREVITFYPLTLILGANGAGKTTLIECLRYSATNEFPPFTNKGKTWIHDLHFAKSHTNRGQVKLSFKDIHGEDCVVTRSLELTAKRDRSGKVVPQMRTLDAIIKRGEETVVSTKCVQIDSVMLDLLGVSKAVLSDVIFCHQEDSNWPLSESKVLKEKFDQLFGSIGYVKALKKIKDERAEYAKLQAHCDGELKLFQEHKVQFETFFNDLAKQKADLSSCKERMNTLVSELGPIKKELESLAVKEKAMVEVEKTISGLQAQLDEQQKSIEYLEKNIKDIFNGTKEDLLEKIANFSDDLRKKELNLKKAEKDIDEFEDNLKQLNTKLNRISSTKIKLEAKQSKFSGDKKKFQNLIDRLSNETFAGFEEASHLDIENDTESTLAKVQNLVDLQRCQVESELKKTIEQYDMKIKEVDDKLDDLKSKKSKMEQTIKINNESIQAKNSEAKRITAQLKEISQSSSKFKQYAKDIEVKKEELAQIEKDSDLDEIQTRINELYETILKSKAKLDELNKEKDKLQEQNEARAVLQVYLKNQEREQDNLSTIYAENVQLLTDLNIDEQDYDKSFADELKARIRQVERKFKTKEAEKESMLNDRRKLENQLDRIKIKFEDCKKEIKDKESKIKSVCGSTSFEKVLESTETELKSLRNKSANSSGAQTLLTEYSVIIEKDGNCPVCDTDVSSNKSKVKQSLSEKIRKLPQEAKKVDEILAKKEEFYGQLLRLKADYDTVKNSKDLLPKLKQDVADAQKKVDGITEKIEKVEKELKKEKSELDRLRAVESQATSYDNSARALQEIERKIRKCKEELGSEENDEMRSIDDIREEIEDLTNDLRQKENELKELQDTKDATTTKIGSLKQIILDLESKKLELEKGQQRQVSLTEKCSELQQQIAQLTKDVKNFENEIKFFEPKLIEAESTKKKLIKEKETERAKRESLLSKLNRYQDDFIAVGEDIQSYLMDDTDSEIQDLKEEFDQCKRDIEELNGKKIELSKICDCHRKDIIEAESKERNLNDNLQLMERNEKAKQYKEKLEKEILKRGAADSVALLKKKTQLEKQFLEKSNQLNQIKGKQEPIVNRIRELEDYLSTDKYAKAKENYSKKLIDSVEIEAICDDLNKLYRALDHSVMVFHKKKMDEINRYLYKLWKQAYRGNDIDYIKIESDTDTERSASDKRRSFNYRVVMIRDRAEMDMRGRCSAGQKVIASLVIRLALAEIFSVNCGILALDEPTTNLDKDNIQAFADSVTNIVRLHKNQRFQLVIITHDDQFLKCLRESEVEFYYEVSKDDKGYSKIKQLSIREREM